MSNQPLTDKNGFLQSVRPQKNLGNLFVWLIGVSALICTVIYAIIGNGRFSDGFFVKGGDFFMDCFNSIRDASQGSAVYSERGVIYPPMANLIFLFLSRFTNAEYNNTTFAARYFWTLYSECLLLVLVVLVICVTILLFTLLATQRNSSDRRRFALAAAAILSAPLLNLLERGNMILLCLVAMIIYAFTYDSESRVWREIGLLCLAFAFSLKLYPVVFGWFLIADKRYKDAIRCALYGVAMLVIPSFFFGGPIFCLVQVIKNVFSFSTGSGNTITKVMNALHFPGFVQSLVNILAYVWVLICAISFAVSPFLRKDQPWKTWVLGWITILCIPSLTGMYNWALLLIPMLMLFTHEKNTKQEWIAGCMMIIPFLHIPFRFSLHVTPSEILIYGMTAALSIFSVIDFLRDVVAYFREKKQA